MSTTQRAVLSFDGVDDLVEIARNLEHKIARDLTIEAWVFVTGRTHYAGIVSRIFDTGATESGYGLLLDNSGGFYAAIKATGQGYQYLTSGAGTLPGGAWHHVAITWDGQQATLYVDGEKKTAYACPGATLHHDPEHDLTIGAYRDNDERYSFSGKIAEVRLWKVARTAQQLGEARFRQLLGNETGLVGYWPFDEGSGAVVADKTRQASHGKIVGATWEKLETPFAGPSAPGTGPSGPPSPCLGSFNTMEVRPWNEPRLLNSKEIAFARTPPSVAVSLTALDLSYQANVRIRAFADQITQQGFQMHADAWADTVLYSAGCSWLEVAPNDPLFQCGQFNTMEDHPWNRPQLQTSRQISFARPYATPPKVVVWLNSLDMSNGHNWRVKVYVTDVTTTGFTIHVDTWADTILYSAGATWVAMPSDRPNLVTGSFNTQELRPWNQVQLTHSKTVSFQGAGYTAAPRLVYGLDSLDLDCRRNLRLKMTADGLTATGVTLHLDSWSDSVLYSAGGSFIAIG